MKLSQFFQNLSVDLEPAIENALKLQRENASIAKDTVANFILQELAIGLTFASLAHHSRLRGSAENADRQKAAAQEVHQTILKFLPGARPTPQQKQRIEADLAELDWKLQVLGA